MWLRRKQHRSQHQSWALILLGVLLLWCLGLVFTGCQSQPSEHSMPRKQLRIVVIELTASDCEACRDIHQIIQDLKMKYKRRIRFLTLDISNRHDREYAQRTAQAYNCGAFVKRHLDRPGLVAVLNTLNGMPLAMLENDTNPEHYEAMMTSVLTQQKGHETH